MENNQEDLIKQKVAEIGDDLKRAVSEHIGRPVDIAAMIATVNDTLKQYYGVTRVDTVVVAKYDTWPWYQKVLGLVFNRQKVRNDKQTLIVDTRIVYTPDTPNIKLDTKVYSYYGR